MNDPALVRSPDPVASLPDKRRGLVRGQRPMFTQPLGQIASGQVLHDDVRLAARQQVDVVNLDHVGALDARGRFCFAQET